MDAIAVWQHQDDGSWDIYYSIWDHSAKQWYVPGGGVAVTGGGGTSAPIAVDDGDDHDPDVSSDEDFAVAVWTKQTGGNTIYYSLWQQKNWTVPAKLSSDDKDTDPTVAVDANGDALSVWVNGGTSLYYSYYSKGIGWTTPERIDTQGIGKVSLPELAYGRGSYYLVFTGTDSSGATDAYVATYSAAGWGAPIKVGSDALLDNGVPTEQRTGISAAETMDEATAVWPGSGNELYSVKLGGSVKNYADGQMPDAAYDSSETANGAHTDDEDLFHQPDVNSPTAVKTISSLLQSDNRASLTFIRDRDVGLAVWWTRVIPTAQIYYSYYENNQWMGVNRIDIILDGSYNRNPAVSPLRKLSEEEGPYCGDKVINQPWEQCEVGIACPNPKDWCNVKNCQCYHEYPPGNETVDCAANSWASAFGMPIWKPGMICIDNCKATFGNDWSCDATCNCNKGPPPPPPKTVSCVANTGALKFGISFYQPGDMCKDDCDQLGDEYFCDMVSCACDKKPKKREVSCGENTWGDILFGKPGFNPGDICKDDCDEYGENYECDAVKCVCEEKEDAGTVSCAGHTQEVIRTDKNTFDPSSQVCKDNCEKLGEGYECNMQSCTCTKPTTEEMSCAGNTMSTLFDFEGATNESFDPQKHLCVDDCEKTFDTLNVVCEPKKCVCEYAMTCAENTLDTIDYGKNFFKGGQCIDNCDRLGEGYQCDVEACLCRRSDDTANVFCAANTDDALERGVEKRPQAAFDPNTMLCIDNCKEVYPEGYVCNSQSCICEPTESEDISCSFNTQYVDATDKNVFNPSAQQCRDDCVEYMGSDYECNMQSCTCTKKKEDVSCTLSTISDFIDFSFGLGEEEKKDEDKFSPSTMICHDDCEMLGAAGLGDYACNLQTCKCEPATTCAANTLETSDTFSNPFTATTTTPAARICIDNCKKLGDGYTCDMQACVCRKAPGDKVNCAANTEDAYLNDALNTTQTRFSPSTQQCVDDCREVYGTGTVCDIPSCFCVPGEGQDVSCAAHTDYVIVTDVNKFDASKMQCKDDCAEHAGSEYECNMQSCTCTKKGAVANVSCADNTGATTTTSLDQRYPGGWSCKDDCSKLGTNYNCNPESCTCYPVTGPPTLVSCADNTGETHMSNDSLDILYGKNQWQCMDDCDRLTDGTYICETGSCYCQQVVFEGYCGDGVISYGEDCDYGSADTNKCPEGDAAFPNYCTGGCTCKQIEHTPRCGDGKITYGEDCDGGNVNTNICPTGYKCYTPECTCIVEEGTGQCGDGKVTPPEECDHGNTYTERCPDNKVCYSCECLPPGEVPEEEFCGNNKREGYEECDGTDDSACGANEYCSGNCECVEEVVEGYCGDGVIVYPEQCESDNDCSEDEVCSGCQCVEVTVTYYYCGDEIVTGNEECEFDYQCSEGEICYNCQCLAPPVVNCDSWCAGEGYSQSLGSGYTTGSACSDAASESQEMCWVKCIYTKFGTWSNPAGTTTCCCKHKYMEECTPTQGGGCECPSESEVENVICPQHAP